VKRFCDNLQIELHSSGAVHVSFFDSAEPEETYFVSLNAQGLRKIATDMRELADKLEAMATCKGGAQ
jgi:hypothetical protein